MAARETVLALALTSALGACASAPPAVSLSSAGSGPETGSYRFFAEAPGERPADFLVRPRVETTLAAKGFVRADANPRYLIEVSVTARPLNVGGAGVKPPGWIDGPVASGPGLGDDHVCAVRVRFVDAKSLNETYSVSASQHAPVKDCNTENFRLVALALKDIPLKK